MLRVERPAPSAQASAAAMSRGRACSTDWLHVVRWFASLRSRKPRFVPRAAAMALNPFVPIAFDSRLRLVSVLF